MTIVPQAAGSPLAGNRNSFAPKEPDLRDYQAAAVINLRAAISELQATGKPPRVLLVAPTGSGKGTLASWMILRAVQRNRRVLFLVNRRDLVRDLSRRLFALGINHGVIMGAHPARPWLPVQVASIDTLHRREHLPPADLIFLDEAHFSISPIWLKVISRYDGVPMIGMTATPIRADSRGLGDIYNAMVECPGTAALTELGHLAPARVFAPGWTYGSDLPHRRALSHVTQEWYSPWNKGWQFDAPSYDADLNLMSGVEARIVERGWWIKYAKAIGELLDCGVGLPQIMSNDEAFRLITAPAAARCSAAARVVRDMEVK